RTPRRGAGRARRKATRPGRQQARPTAKDKTGAEKRWGAELQRLADNARWLEEQREALRARLGETAGWLAFFHTDRQHRVRSMRFRKPFEKRFQSFHPYRGRPGGSPTGVFGHGLFRPFAAESRQALNRLLLVQGEFN